MTSLRLTLLADGSSDEALLPLISRLILDHLPDLSLGAQRADLTKLKDPPKSLSCRIKTTLRFYQTDLLLIHRDAEGQSREKRLQEINSALTEIEMEPRVSVPVIPVRMTEAWLLVDESAIRAAAGNPNGGQPLELPRVSRLERVPDPKAVLIQALERASGLSGRRLRRFQPGRRVHQVPLHLEDLTSLRKLTSFQHLEANLREVLDGMY